MEDWQKKLIIGLGILVLAILIIGIVCYFVWYGKKEGYTIIHNSDSKDINSYVDSWINSIKNIYTKSTYVDSRTRYNNDLGSPIEASKIYSGDIKYN
jgi:flagellar basal body-associated protein FliL